MQKSASSFVFSWTRLIASHFLALGHLIIAAPQPLLGDSIDN
jgi:hypothetical protein